MQPTRDYRPYQRQFNRHRNTNMTEVDALRQEVHALKNHLGRARADLFSERNRSEQLCHELNGTQQELRRQKTLKEMFINRGKETKRELENLQKYADPATLSTARIAEQVRATVRQKKKKDLHKDYEELRVAHIIFQEKFTNELQVEKDENRLLKEELEKFNAGQHSCDTGRLDQLCQELAATKEELDRQKTLKEMYINRGKETKRELENLQKYADPATLSTARIAEQVRETFRQKKKKDLHTDYEELRVAHIISQEKFTNELQVEKDKSRLLEEELEKMKVWQQDYSRRYEEEVAAARQQAAFLQHELDNEIQTHAARASADLALIQNLRAEKDYTNHSVLQREVEQLTKQLNVQMALNLDLSTELRVDRDDDEDTPSRRKRHRPEEPRQEKTEEKPCPSEDQQPGTSETSSSTTVSHRPRITRKNKWMRNRNLDNHD